MYEEPTAPITAFISMVRNLEQVTECGMRIVMVCFRSCFWPFLMFG